MEVSFVGFRLRRRAARLRDGRLKSGFLPAVSKQAMKSMATVIRSWQLGRWTALSFKEIATMINPVVAGWSSYYGRLDKSRLMRFLEQQYKLFLGELARRKVQRLRPGSSR